MNVPDIEKLRCIIAGTIAKHVAYFNGWHVSEETMLRNFNEAAGEIVTMLLADYERLLREQSQFIDLQLFYDQLIDGQIIKESDGEPWALTKSEAEQIVMAIGERLRVPYWPKRSSPAEQPPAGAEERVQCMTCGEIYCLEKKEFRPCPKCGSTAIHFKVYAEKHREPPAVSEDERKLVKDALTQADKLLVRRDRPFGTFRECIEETMASMLARVHQQAVEQERERAAQLDAMNEKLRLSLGVQLIGHESESCQCTACSVLKEAAAIRKGESAQPLDK